jgi:hypothetical protein
LVEVIWDEKIQAANQHKVMAETYKSILEKSFADTD